MSGPVDAGTKIKKPPTGFVRPKKLRYYNFDGKPFSVEVPLDEWTQCLIKDQAVVIGDAAAVEKFRDDRAKAAKEAEAKSKKIVAEARAAARAPDKPKKESK